MSARSSVGGTLSLDALSQLHQPTDPAASSARAYLGDGVYVAVERGMVKLTTENGIEVTNTVYLEPDVYEALAAWYARLRGALQTTEPEDL